MNPIALSQTNVYRARDLVLFGLAADKPKAFIQDVVDKNPDHPYVLAYKYALEALEKALEGKENNAAP